MAQTAQLTITIDAQNKASAQLNQVKDSAEGAGLGFKSLAGAMALGNLAAEGVSKGVEILHSSISKAIEENNSMAASWSQINGILGNVGKTTGVTKDQIAKAVEVISKTTPVSESAALAATQMIVPFAQIGKDVFPKVLTASTDLATHLNHGLAPASDQVAGAAKIMGVAFADPEKSFGRLKKAGVDLTSQQQDQIKALQNSGNLVGAQKKLYEDLSGAIGGSAVAAGNTFSGKVTEIKNNLIELEAKGVAKVQNALVQLFNWLEKNKQKIDELANKVKAVLKTSFDVLVDVLKTLVNGLKTAYDWYEKHKTLANILIQVLGALATAVLIIYEAHKTFGKAKDIIKDVQKSWAILSAFMEANPIVFLITAIIAIGILLMLHWKTVSKIAEEVWHKISGFFTSLWGDIQKLFAEGIAWIKSHWDLILDILLGPIGFVIGELIKHWSQIKAGFADALNFVKNIWNGITGFFAGLWHGITGTVGQIGDVLKGAFKDAFNAIIGLWDDTMGKIFHGQKISVGPVHFDLPNLAIPKMALGGEVGAGQAVTWGEAGGEIFVPSTAGTIMPNSRVNGAIGNNDHSKHITITQHITYARQSDPTANARRLAFELMRR